MKNKILNEDFKYISSKFLPWKKLFGKTIFITGANGFLPSYIIEFLFFLNDYKKSRIKIIGNSRNRNNVNKRFYEYRKRNDFKIIIQDVSQSFRIKENVNYIIHAASQASPRFYEVDPVGTLKPNILGTYNLLELARIKPVQGILFISAGEVYGNIQISGKTDEITFGSLNPASVRSCYAESKRMTETMAVSWHHQYAIPTKIARLYHTYGPRLKLKDGRVFSDFIANIVKNENIVMKSSGEAVRSFIYVADVVSAFFTILLKGKSGQAYNVANENATVSIKQLAQTLVKLFPGKKLKVILQKRSKGDRYLDSPIKFNYPSTAKLQSLGWKPHFSITQGFRRTVQSFRKV